MSRKYFDGFNTLFIFQVSCRFLTADFHLNTIDSVCQEFFVRFIFTFPTCCYIRGVFPPDVAHDRLRSSLPSLFSDGLIMLAHL